MSTIEDRLRLLEARNQRVEADKAWETSLTRRCVIATITYGCGVILLITLGHDDAWKHAFVPVMGYVLSTLSLPPLKKIWLKCKGKKQKASVLTAAPAQALEG